MVERQLDIFKSRKQRGVIARPRAKEFELHCMIADVLRRWCSPLWRYTHMPAGEKRDMVTAMRLKRMGVTPGWADFQFFGPRRAVVFMELKRPGGGGRLSEPQEELSRFLVDCGHKYITTNDFQHALDQLRDLEIVLARVSA